RSGHDRIEIDGRLTVAPEGPTAARVADAGGALDGDGLLLHRSVSAEGRSRAVAGGRPVPIALLGELAEELITVHGQADQRGLLRPAVQRATLDRYAGDELAAA